MASTDFVGNQNEQLNVGMEWRDIKRVNGLLHTDGTEADNWNVGLEVQRII